MGKKEKKRIDREMMLRQLKISSLRYEGMCSLSTWNNVSLVKTRRDISARLSHVRKGEYITLK